MTATTRCQETGDTVEDIIGQRTDDRQFATFLAAWRRMLDRRVDELRERLAAVPGLEGAVLGGSVGRGEPWPLSDIDILPIFTSGAETAARAEIEQLIADLQPQWAEAGWYTGIDLGVIAFAADEVDRVLEGAVPLADLLADPRWYHALDKGYRSRSLNGDTDDRSSRLARWLTDHRFVPDVVRYRIDHAAREDRAARDGALAHAERGDLRLATLALWKAIQWRQIGLMESWGERDNSLGRFGTRFRRLAADHDCADVADELDRLAGLDDAHLARRMGDAPWWVWQRHERSLAARRAVGEDVSARTDQRDTLRVSAMYAARRSDAVEPWLGLASDAADVRRSVAWLTNLVSRGPG